MLLEVDSPRLKITWKNKQESGARKVLHRESSGAVNPRVHCRVSQSGPSEGLRARPAAREAPERRRAGSGSGAEHVRGARVAVAHSTALLVLRVRSSRVSQVGSLWQPGVGHLSGLHRPNIICSLCVSGSHVGHSHSTFSCIFFVTFVVVFCDE